MFSLCPKKYLKAGNLDKVFFRLGLTGYPLDHSLSPILHKAALEAAGLPGSYDLFPVLPSPEGPGELKLLADRIRTGQLQGLNITIPHKQSILQFVDEHSPAVQRVGAANVIYKADDCLVGENTDIAAFKNDLNTWLSTFTPWPLPDRKALVLGAGGAARAVADALLCEGWEVWIAARNLHQAIDLCASLSPWYPGCTLKAIPLVEKPLAGLNFPMLIVNATPAGMPTSLDQSPWPAGVELPRGSFIYDLIYNPFETKLLKAARAAALPAISGGGMLVAQAALAFSLWTGQPSPDQVMRVAFDRHIELSQKKHLDLQTGT